MTKKNSATASNQAGPQDGGLEANHDWIEHQLDQANHLLVLAEWIERARNYISRLREQEDLFPGFAEELGKFRLTSQEAPWSEYESEGLQALTFCAQDILASAAKSVRAAAGGGQ
ncbi:MAG: hypothetical protein ACTHL8_01085 [Burkholderiaceae bacterium]